MLPLGSAQVLDLLQRLEPCVCHRIVVLQRSPVPLPHLAWGKLWQGGH